MMTIISRTASAVLFFLVSIVGVSAQPARKELTPNPLIKIIRYEDQRNWNDDLKTLLSNADPLVGQRAALAAGRIGDARAIPTLADMLLTDRDKDVRQMVAFALGEIESTGGAFALTEVLKDRRSDLVEANVRARAVEALGKIVAATTANGSAATTDLNTPEGDRLDIIKAAILDTLRFDEEDRRSRPDRLTILLALTAVLRSRPEGAGVGPLVAKFLDYPDPEIVATALNTMARLRLKAANERVRELLNHNDPIVRANAARVIGAAEHKEAFDAVLDRALKDPDIRVRASAIRALGALKDDRAAKPLSDRMYVLMEPYRRGDHYQIALNAQPQFKSEWLEVVTALGNILRGKPRVFASLTPPFGVPKAPARYELTWNGMHVDPEIDTAFAKMNPDYVAAHANPMRDAGRQKAMEFFADWRHASSWAQGLAVIATLTEKDIDGDVTKMKQQAVDALRTVIDDKRLSPIALPNVLNAYATFKPADADGIYIRALENRDVIVRSTAAELLGNQSPSEANTRALVEALPRALRDKDLNDAALAILDALGKQKNQAANDAIKSALNSDDHLIRRKAVALLKTNGAGDFSDRVGLVKTRYTDIDYRRAMARIGKHPTATIVTSRGSFTIEFLAADASLNVDNFIQLAKRGYFNGQTIPRVVPNFVVQAGDPRGDQNGGPGYQIRCEINEAPYERAAVGMALSGKDTGGSQWFVTHSPQPHLDGGYTVFGRVIRGMDVVDNIARGDVIRRVIVNER